MRKINFAFLLVAAVLGFYGCASTNVSKAENKNKNQTPEWVYEPTRYYPTDRYFCAVGQGADRNAAELEAVKGVAGAYGQNIQSVSVASKRMELALKDGIVASSTNSQEFGTDITNQINQEDLIGIEIKEFWKEPSTGFWYCLAYLDKAKTADLYASMVNKNYAEIQNLAEKAQKELSLHSYALYDFAEEIAAVTEKYFERLYILDWKKAETVQKVDFSSKTLNLKKVEIAREIPIYVNVENDVNQQLATAVAAALTKFGFNSTSDSSRRYSLCGEAIFTETENSKKTILYTKCQLPLRLHDKLNDEVIISVNVEKREGSSTFEDAKNRAVNSCKKMVESKFSQEFSNYLGQMKIE